MWEKLIAYALKNRLMILMLAGGLIAYSVYILPKMPLDALPEISAPTVTVMAGAYGMAANEVEQRITVPLEGVLNGIPGLRRIRSKSSMGLSVIWIEFNWDTDPFKARQVVAERLQIVQGTLGKQGISPIIAPMSSIMGEIMVLGVTGKPGTDLMKVREWSDFVVSRKLTAIPGVAQITPIGGGNKQLQIILKPEMLNQLAISPTEVQRALEGSINNSSGGIMLAGDQEYLIRGVSRSRKIEDIGKIVIDPKGPLLLRHIADIKFAPALERGRATVNGNEGILLVVQKHPESDTLKVTARIDQLVENLNKIAPEGLSIFNQGFRQERFIKTAIGNISQHLLESVILIIILLMIFLKNKRTAFISLMALPLSLLSGIAVLKLLGYSINTMTLGGFAIAIGALVDDAIIDVENVHRRLKERAKQPESDRPSILHTIYNASCEIRHSIVYATYMIILVFTPLFFLTGLEGKLMKPLGVAYIAAIFASLVVAVTITPVLCALLLSNEKLKEEQETIVSRGLKRLYKPLISIMIRLRYPAVLIAIAGVAAALFMLLQFGRDFMPRFNEGNFAITTYTPPGTSLEHTDKMMKQLEAKLIKLPFVMGFTRRTGHGGEKDEHAHDVNMSGMDIVVDQSIDPEVVSKELRAVTKTVPGLTATVTRPIALRIAHMNTGSTAPLLIQIYGDDLVTLRLLAQQVSKVMEGIKGIVDLSIEQQSDIPQLMIYPNYTELARYGLPPRALLDFVNLAYIGKEVGIWQNRDRFFDIVLRYPESARENIQTIKKTPMITGDGTPLRLKTIASVTEEIGPNMVTRKNGIRTITVNAGISGRDGKSVIDEVKSKIAAQIQFPQGYHPEYEGDFESEARASKTIIQIFIAVLIIMLLLIWQALGNLKDAFLVLTNLPLALIGGVISIMMMDGLLTMASMIGLISLFGIATRNGIMLVTHYRFLRGNGMALRESVVQGSLERIIPITMTALATALALIPVALAMGEPGNELQAPMAVVILGGIISAMILNLFLLPALYYLLHQGEKAFVIKDSLVV